MIRRLVILLLTVWASTLIQVGPVLAQGLIRKLQNDGAWSRFRVTGQYDVSWLRNRREFPNWWKDHFAAIPDFDHWEAELVISSVGTEEIGGEQLRWIELFLKNKADGEAEGREEDEGTFLRIQVAEKVMSTGGDLLENTRKAPFGVKQIWETDGVTIEHSGPYDPKDKNCDGPGTIRRGNTQIVLIESGIGVVSRLKSLATKSQRSVSPTIQSTP